MVKYRTVISNIFLAVITLFLGMVCLYPVAAAVSGDKVGTTYREGNRQSNGVSLMVNVYQSGDVVQNMLTTLKKHKAKATFFIGGCWADDNAATVKQIVAEGHELGSHGYFHKDCDKLSREELTKEITLSRKLLLLQTGKEITLFAPPSGAYNGQTEDVCAELGLKMILWSKDTIDWRDRNIEVIYERATKGVTGGEFILMHPMPETASALERILTYYEENGLRAVTVTENLTYGG